MRSHSNHQASSADGGPITAPGTRAVSTASAAVGAASDAGRVSRNLLLVALACAALGVAFLMLYLERFEAEASGGERIQLLTVITPVPRGTVLTDDMVAVREVPVAYVEPRAVRAAELSKVRGILTATDLDTQDGLMWSDLALDTQRRDLATLVQPGNRALTIEAHRNHLVRPGDYVDVLGTFGSQYGGDFSGSTVVLLQRVLVLAVGEDTDRQVFAVKKDSDAASKGFGLGAPTITLSLQLHEAQLIAAAGQQGKLGVVLRGRSDSSVTDGMPRVTAKNLVSRATDANARRARASGSDGPIRIDGPGTGAL